MLSVAPRSSRLLVIRLQRPGHRVVYHEANVGLVNSHSERVRRYDHADTLGHERLLNIAPMAVVETCVIRGGGNSLLLEHAAQPVYRLSGRSVNDAKAILLAQCLNEPRVFLRVVSRRQDVIREVRAIEPGDD